MPYTLPDDVEHQIEIRYAKIKQEGKTDHWFWKLDNEAALIATLAVTEGGGNKSAKNALKDAIAVCDKSYTARELLRDLEDY